MDSRKPIPEDIILLSRDNGIVSAGLSSWRAGHCSWEEMLIAVVKALAERNAHLTEQCIELAKMQPPPIIIKDGMAFKFNDDPS